MKILKSILAIIVVAALLTGAYIYLTKAESPSSSTAPAASIILNEFMASNSCVLPDDKGNYDDWIEIYNPTANTIDLTGYGLSNVQKAAKWTFPAIMINAKSYMVVFASGGSGTSDVNAVYQHTNFKLSADKGGVYLFDTTGQVIESIEYKSQLKNVSLGRDPNNNSQWISFQHPTPGFVNDETGYSAFEQSRIAKSTDIILTEVMAANKTTITDNKGNYSDYIEIYNKSNKAINLNGYGLSDDPAKVLKWKFPNISINPGAYLMVFASGEDMKGTDLTKGAIHTNFGLSAYKGTIILSDPMGYILDQVTTTEMPRDIAYARVQNSGGSYGDKWEQTNQPTPGYPNNSQGYTDFQKSKAS